MVNSKASSERVFKALRQERRPLSCPKLASIVHEDDVCSLASPEMSGRLRVWKWRPRRAWELGDECDAGKWIKEGALDGDGGGVDAW